MNYSVFFIGSELKLNDSPHRLFLSHITTKILLCFCVNFVNLNIAPIHLPLDLLILKIFLLIVVEHADVN